MAREVGRARSQGALSGGADPTNGREPLLGLGQIGFA